MTKLLNCPFCGSEPTVNNYPTFITIFCVHCKENHRSVEVFGDGHYSEWCKTQTANEHGMITISAELNPVSDTEAFNRLSDKWNERV